MGKHLTFRLPDGKEHLWEETVKKFKEENGEPESNTEIIIEVLTAYTQNPRKIISSMRKEKKKREEWEEAVEEILDRLKREGIGEPTVIEKLREGL